MVELVTQNEIEKDTLKVMTPAFNYEYEQIRLFTQNVASSQALGEALYNSGFLDIFRVVNKDYFIRNYSAVFSFFSRLGTAESYIGLFKGLFGSDTVVTFNESPAGVINASVVAQLDTVIWRTGIDLDEVITQDNTNILFSTIFTELDLLQTQNLLKALVPYGILGVFEISNSGEVPFNFTLRSF